MFTRRFSTAALCALALAGGLAVTVGISNARAEITAEQKTQAKEIEDKLTEAGKLLLKNQNEEAGKLVEEAQTLWTQLASGGKGTDYNQLVERLKGLLGVRRRLLESRGVKLTPLPEPGKTAKSKTPAASEVSFNKQIAPILVGACRNCHIQRASGMFSMATYNALMMGKGGASVIEKGKADRSRMMEVIESGEMPQNGRKLPDEQIKLLATWINQGAKFDGDNPAANIAANLPKKERPKLDVVKASGKETVKYSRDIASVISTQCTSCHGGQNPRAQLSLETFNRLLRGSNNGVILTPGKPAESELIKRLKGEGVQRMPLNAPPLPNDVIAKFEKWIAEGAKFDGSSADMQTETVAKIYQVTQMTHDELAKERVGIAGQNWKLANPDDKASQVETKNFLLVGNVGESRLKEVGEAAEKLKDRVSTALGGQGDKPLVKGRVTIFVFARRFDYSEYGQMVEKRELPREWIGHYKYTIIDAYACLVPPQTREEGTLDGLVAEQLAGVYVESLGGDVPGWFSQGTAWAVASNMSPKDARVATWSDQIPSALSKMKKADDFITGQLSAGDAAVLNYSFAKYLMSKTANFRQLLGYLRKGADFQQAFLGAYKGTPAQVATLWAPGAARNK
jgi:mono/diheme cytochrome c family protein